VEPRGEADGARGGAVVGNLVQRGEHGEEVSVRVVAAVGLRPAPDQLAAQLGAARQELFPALGERRREGLGTLPCGDPQA
jgi:hypothetical protein